MRWPRSIFSISIDEMVFRAPSFPIFLNPFSRGAPPVPCSGGQPIFFLLESYHSNQVPLGDVVTTLAPVLAWHWQVRPSGPTDASLDDNHHPACRAACYSSMTTKKKHARLGCCVRFHSCKQIGFWTEVSVGSLTHLIRHLTCKPENTCSQSYPYTCSQSQPHLCMFPSTARVLVTSRLPKKATSQRWLEASPYETPALALFPALLTSAKWKCASWLQPGES